MQQHSVLFFFATFTRYIVRTYSHRKRASDESSEHFHRHVSCRNDNLDGRNLVPRISILVAFEALR